MKGTKEFKNQKGITLIALVITIIVMLILVAVTIALAINGGLFEYARYAGAKTNETILAEQVLANGRLKIKGIWYDSIDDYLNNNPSVDQGDGKTETDAKYFTFVFHDSTKVASNTQTKTSLTKTATITGINPQYAPNAQYYGNNYYSNGYSRPKYIQDGDLKIMGIVIPKVVMHEGEAYTVTEIGECAFYDSELTSVVIPETVTKIGYGAFGDCSRLRMVSLASGIKEIDDGAFQYCNLTSIRIPASVERMGREVFAGCDGLENIYCEAKEKPEGWASGNYYSYYSTVDRWSGSYATVHWGA